MAYWKNTRKVHQNLPSFAKTWFNSSPLELPCTKPSLRWIPDKWTFAPEITSGGINEKHHIPHIGRLDKHSWQRHCAGCGAQGMWQEGGKVSCLFWTLRIVAKCFSTRGSKQGISGTLQLGSDKCGKNTESEWFELEFASSIWRHCHSCNILCCKYLCFQLCPLSVARRVSQYIKYK